jgi:hypothetical protein
MKFRSSVLILSVAFVLALDLQPMAPSANAISQNTQSQNAQSENAGPPLAAEPERTKTEAEMNTDAVEYDKPGSTSKRGRRRHRTASSSTGGTRVQMRNVDFHVDDTIILHIRNLRGALLRKNRATPPVFDDKRSFLLRIDSGTIGISADSLTDLMNNYVFAYPKAPLEKIGITIEENQIKMTATIHKVTDISVEIKGDLSATPEGKLQLHPTSIKAAGIPVKGLLNLFGVELDDLIKATESHGVKIDDNDIIMDPEMIIPPPEIRGKITAVQIEGNEVIQFFGPANKPSGAAVSRLTPSRRRGANYMYYRGGTIRFGKLTMTNADLKIVDRDSRNAFDFSIDHYNRQLVAGYSKNTPSFGLVVFMPDYYKVQKKSP